jgi:Fic family protein
MNTEAFRNSPSGRLVHARTGYWAFVPNDLAPEIAWSTLLVNALSRADRALGELGGLGRSLPHPRLLIMPFVRREAMLSSRIEGTRASLSDVFTYEAAPVSLLAHSRDAAEVYNYVRALEHGLSRLSDLPLSLRLIREIHGQLLEGVRGEEQTPGEFRKTQNWVGGSTIVDAVYVPPPVEEMIACLDSLERYLYQEPRYPALVRLGLIHYQFEAIHPFLDGNGRMGRLLMVLLMCQWGLLPQPLLYLSAYFEANRSSYYASLLAVSQVGAWEEWLLFFLAAVLEQAEDAVTRSRRLLDLRDAYRQRLQSERVTARVLTALDVVFGRPVISVTQLAQSMNVHYPAAQRYVEALENAGLLVESTGQGRNRLYRADGIMAELE